jgi:hypothetical protein
LTFDGGFITTGYNHPVQLVVHSEKVIQIIPVKYRPRQPDGKRPSHRSGPAKLQRSPVG